MTLQSGQTTSPMLVPSAAARGATMVRVEGLTHRYGERVALRMIDMEIGQGEFFGLLGPNGSGKSTLLRILGTLLRPSEGRITVGGHDVLRESAAVRDALGVVFQSPGLDGKLSVEENLRFQGYLFGMRGAMLKRRIGELLDWLTLANRARDKVETLSGGLKRRVELAKALLHQPRLLLLDEPSTGLDPAARQAFWRLLGDIRAETGLTVVVTTHLLDEADDCHRVALLAQGQLVAMDDPEKLKARLGMAVARIKTRDPEGVLHRLREEEGLPAELVDGEIRVTGQEVVERMPGLMKRFHPDIDAFQVGRPTLEDVFLAMTGYVISTHGEGEDTNG